MKVAPRRLISRLRVMHMRWRDLAFFHWPIDAEPLRQRLPPAIRLDTFAGQAWIGISPFLMTAVRPAYLPPLPGISAFPEINVRTYVIANGVPGIWFFSLDAAQAVAVRAARMAFNLPYHHARVSMEREADGVRWRSERSQSGAAPAVFSASYRPTGNRYSTKPGDLDHWLTERYCLYSVSHVGKAFRLSIDHRQWPLQPAEGEIIDNTLLAADHLPPVSGPPLVHFAKELDVWGHLPEKL